MTPTKELKAKLQSLFNEKGSQLLCEAWDIHPDHLNDYVVLTGGSESPESKLSSEVRTPAGFNSPRTRQPHHISNFG